MFFWASLIADFYNDMELIPIVRVLSLTLIISGVKNVQQAYVSRKLLFKRFFFSTLGGTIGAAVVGISMAYMGFGVWALVTQQLFNAVVDTVILWMTVKWRPKWMFSFQRLKGLFSYGWKLLVSSLIDTTYNNVRQLIIGKFYTKSDLAYFNKGKQFPALIMTNINSSIDSVLLPIMSQEQDNRERLKNMTRKAVRTSCYFMWPLIVGLAVVSEPLVSLLLTDKWLSCVPYLRIFCFVYALWPIHTANLNAIRATGRSDIFLRLEILKKILGVTVIIITIPFGVLAVALGNVFIDPIGAALNAYPNKKLIGYTISEMMKDLFPELVLTLVMGICIWPIQYFGLSDILTIICQVLGGVAVYLTGSILFKMEVYLESIEMIKEKFANGLKGNKS